VLPRDEWRAEADRRAEPRETPFLRVTGRHATRTPSTRSAKPAWELELGYGEIKTDMLDRLESIRCRTIAGVEQELWGILLAYNLIRLEMERTANDFGVEPTRISFVTSLRIICDTWSWCALASPGALPTRLKTMRELFTSPVLPERRTARRYPRAVKIKISNFPRKRPSNA